MGTYAGKLNGAMLAQTPSGTLLTYVSISLLTEEGYKMKLTNKQIKADAPSSLSPSKIVDAAVAVSTTCNPRSKSPRASECAGSQQTSNWELAIHETCIGFSLFQNDTVRNRVCVFAEELLKATFSLTPHETRL